jgi:hypothetical protein
VHSLRYHTNRSLVFLPSHPFSSLKRGALMLASPAASSRAARGHPPLQPVVRLLFRVRRGLVSSRCDAARAADRSRGEARHARPHADRRRTAAASATGSAHCPRVVAGRRLHDDLERLSAHTEWIRRLNAAKLSLLQMSVDNMEPNEFSQKSWSQIRKKLDLLKSTRPLA